MVQYNKQYNIMRHDKCNLYLDLCEVLIPYVGSSGTWMIKYVCVYIFHFIVQVSFDPSFLSPSELWLHLTYGVETSHTTEKAVFIMFQNITLLCVTILKILIICYSLLFLRHLVWYIVIFICFSFTINHISMMSYRVGVQSS